MWEATLNDGRQVSEKRHRWSDVKQNIKTLTYNYNGICFTFPPSNEYIQYKTASASLAGGEAEIESQTIGIVIDAVKILTRFNLKENKIDVIADNNA